MYIEPRRYGDEDSPYHLCMDLPDETDVAGISLGEQIEVTVRGVVKGLDAESETEDYSYDPKPGTKRRMKKVPAKIEIELTGDPEMKGLTELNLNMRDGDD